MRMEPNLRNVFNIMDAKTEIVVSKGRHITTHVGTGDILDANASYESGVMVSKNRDDE